MIEAWRYGLEDGTPHLWDALPYIHSKNATPIEDIAPGWDAASLAQRDIREWLTLHGGTGHNAVDMVAIIR